MGKKHKKQVIMIVICVCAGVCLAGGICIAIMLRKNPLAKGLENLAEEMIALEEETGKNFWSDMVNQIGNQNIQAEYSLNIGGIPNLQNVTIGLDGTAKRDMEGQRFAADIQWSVANTDIAESALFATKESLYLQVPSIWQGSVVFKTEDIDGQWNHSPAREQLQKFTELELGIGCDADLRLLESYSVGSFSAADFLKEKKEELMSLYESMEVLNMKRAEKQGLLREEQAEELESYIVEDKEGEKIETTCYLVVLPGRELEAIFEKKMDDIRLCAYLDSQKRIVRVSVLPGEHLVADIGKGRIALNLTGRRATIDRIEGEFSYSGDGKKLFDGASGTLEAEGGFVLEKDAEKERAYSVENRLAIFYQENRLGLSLEGSVQGERLEEGDKLSLDLEKLTVEAEDKVVYRMSGRTTFEPLGERIVLPAEKEYRIGDMGDVETALFLAECVENVYRNYGGYIRMRG